MNRLLSILRSSVIEYLAVRKSDAHQIILKMEAIKLADGLIVIMK